MLFRLAHCEVETVLGHFGRQTIICSEYLLQDSQHRLGFQGTCGGGIRTLQFRQWQSDVRASSGEVSRSSYWIFRHKHDPVYVGIFNISGSIVQI